MQSWVIKIGGSLYSSKYLVEWLEAITKISNRNIVIVPGGGPFADLVREADDKFGLEQRDAHLMAVMAMQQYGMMLTSLCPSLRLAISKEEIHNIWSMNEVAIWAPFNMVRDDCNLEDSWEVTSDSIAVWFASHMQIENILLVKSTDKVMEIKDIHGLSKDKCIDINLPELVKAYNLNFHILHKSQITDFKILVQR